MLSFRGRGNTTAVSGGPIALNSRLFVPLRPEEFRFGPTRGAGHTSAQYRSRIRRGMTVSGVGVETQPNSDGARAGIDVCLLAVILIVRVPNRPSRAKTVSKRADEGLCPAQLASECARLLWPRARSQPMRGNRWRRTRGSMCNRGYPTARAAGR